MVREKASIIQLLLLACLGVSLLAFSSKGADDSDSVGSPNAFAGDLNSLQSPASVYTFANETNDLPQDLVESGITLKDGSISVTLLKNQTKPIYIPLITTQKNLVFSFFLKPACAQINNKWKFTYPVKNGNNSLDIICSMPDGTRQCGIKSASFESGSNFWAISLKDQTLLVCKEKPSEKCWPSKENVTSLLPKKSDVGRGYYEINFSIQHDERSKNCDLMLKFDAEVYMLEALKKLPEDSMPSEPTKTSQGLPGSTILWIMGGVIVGAYCLIAIGLTLLWFFKYRNESVADNGSVKAEAGELSAAPNTPNIQATEVTEREAYAPVRGEVKKQKQNKRSPVQKKSPLRDKKGKGMNWL